MCWLPLRLLLLSLVLVLFVALVVAELPGGIERKLVFIDSLSLVVYLANIPGLFNDHGSKLDCVCVS